MISFFHSSSVLLFSALSSCVYSPHGVQLPSLKLTKELKINGWKMKFLLGWPIFQGRAVSFRECQMSLISRVFCLEKI